MGSLTMASCGLESCPVPGGFVTAMPSLPGNVVLLAGFAAAIPISIYFGVRHGTPLYTLLFVAGILLEALGHIGNILLRDNLASRRFFTMHIMGSITGPTFISAAIYVVLPHVLSVYGERFCEIPSPLWLGLLFFGFAVFTLAFQIVGCVFSVDGISRPEMGQGVNILLAGLGIQVTSLLLYFGIYYGFMIRLSRHHELLEQKHAYIYLSNRFKILLICLQSAAALILIRTITRIVQLSGGMASDLFQSQTVSLVLDSVMVLLACIILTAVPPGVAFGTRAWAETSPHMVGWHSNRRPGDGRNNNAREFSLRTQYGGSSRPVETPYRSPPYQPIMPLRGQQARGYEDQVPAHYQFPNLHKSTSKPRPIHVAPYKPDDEENSGQATSSAGLMQPGSAGSQSYSQSASRHTSDIPGAKRMSPRHRDMVDEQALWG